MATFNYPNDFDGTFWRVLDGDVYVSSSGDDTTGNGTPRNPYKTIAKGATEAATTKKIVVGAGVYSSNSGIDGGAKELHFEADGLVKVIETSIGFKNITTTNSSIKGFKIYGATIIDGAFQLIQDCDLFGQTVNGFSGEVRGCVIDGCTFTGETGLKFYNCTFANTNYAGQKIVELFDCTMNSTVELHMNSAVLTGFNYCNINAAKIFLDTGNITEYNSTAAIYAAFSQYQANGLSVEAKFNDPVIKDYTLKKESLLIAAGRFGQSIGARQQGINLTVAEMLQGLASLNISRGKLTNGTPPYFEVDPMEDEMFISTGMIDLGEVQELGNIRLYAENEFGLTPSNIILPQGNEFDLRPEIMGNFHNNSVHFGMRWWDKKEDLDGSANYKTFIWNKAPKIDNNSNSNGEIDFDPTKSKSIKAQFFQIRFRITNASYFLVQEDAYASCLLQENGANIFWMSN